MYSSTGVISLNVNS